MKKILILLGLIMLTLQGGCQEDKTFKEVVTFEKGFNFVKGGPVQNMPFTGTGTVVTWETLTGKPVAFIPVSHTHKVVDISDMISTDLQSAINSLQVIVIPKLTTAQITALTPTAGAMVFDTTLGVLKIGTGTVFKTVITSE